MKLLGKISSLSEQELIERYKKKRDQKYVAELFSRYSHLIMGVCMKYLKNTEASKDGVMHLYEILSEKVLTSKIDNFGGWVYVVTKNYCIGELRKQAKISEEQKNLVERMEFELLPTPTNNYDFEQQLIALENCIKELNKEQATCVSLFYLKKKNYREVTNLTGFSLNKVKSNIQNGKRNLKNCIETSIEKK